MIKKVIVLSGPVSSGKTTLSDSLEERFAAKVFKTRLFLLDLYTGLKSERTALQEYGEKLDKKHKGKWVCDGLLNFIRTQLKDNEDHTIIVDAVRIKNQIAAIRKAFGNRVVHIHLDAPYDELTRRYKHRHSDRVTELASYDKVQENKTENNVTNLKKIADIFIDTKRCNKADVMVKVASQLGLYGRENYRLVDVLVGGQYGSEGKGHIVSYLSREYDILVRVGGPNAGHTVYKEPKPLTFHHLPSGTVHSDANLIIGPGATIYIPELMEEINKCQLEYIRLAIDPNAMIISDEDRLKEAELVKTMASTGRGGGAAAARRILDRSPGKTKLARDFNELKPFLKPTYELLEDAFRLNKKILLEGTQGTALSLYHGHYPHVTSRDTTVAGCLAEAGISPSRTRKIIMVVRSYPIRVQDAPEGTSGPMQNSISWKTIEERSGHEPNEIESTERAHFNNKASKKSRRV